MSPESRLNELTDKLNYYNHQYYQNSVSEISDFEFDRLLEELKLLEEQYPILKREDSPILRVGGTITKEFPTVVHKYPMLSLGNTYNEQDLIDFDERVKKGLDGQPYEYIAELKFDGVALSMSYENGLLKMGVTRGDGTKGDDITNNVKTIKTLPLKIQTNALFAAGSPPPASFEVRGEGFMPLSSFERLNKEKEDIGEAPLMNPRNAASGAFKLQDSAEVARRGLDCYIYSFLCDELVFQSHEESLIGLKSWGFNVSPGWKKCADIQEVLAYINHWETERHHLPLNTDGIVIKINSYVQQQELGFTAKSPRWAIAYKYKSESATTPLLSVSYQVGRTGSITPVANLKPVLLAGTMVKRASLHNANEIERLGLQIGDTVFVEKGGEIIPKITGFDPNKRKPDSQPLIYITHCPACGSELIRKENEANHYCPNEKGCPPQIKGKLEHFIQRKAMNMESLGEGKIELLFDKGLVRRPDDFYKLTYGDLFGLEKVIEDEETGKTKRVSFKEKTAQNILEAIERSKQVPFEQVLFGIGIRFVGQTVAEKLARFFKNIDTLMAANAEQLISVPEIGERIALSVLDYFADPDNINFVQNLKDAGLQFVADIQEVVAEGNNLEGKTFLYTGTFTNFEREALEQKIEANGGKVVSGVSGKLDYLIVGEKPGASKIDKATKLGVKMISEEEFIGLLSRIDE